MVEKDLGQVIPDITATATIDNTVGTPEVNITVEELEELGRLVNKFKFNFLHLKGEKGDKPVKGVDYFTNQEKEQFTTETKALVTGEGSKQVSLINAETAKVINQVKEIVAGNAATSNALTLNGKTRLEFEKETQGVAGRYNGTFPLTQATLNGVYLLPATGKFYVCTKEYNGTNLTAPNGNFEELSVFKNRDKLENLFKNLEVYNMNDINSSPSITENTGNQFLNKKINSIKILNIKFKGSDFDENGNLLIKLDYRNIFRANKFSFPVLSSNYFNNMYSQASKNYPGTVKIQGWDLANIWISITGNIKKEGGYISIAFFGSK